MNTFTRRIRSEADNLDHLFGTESGVPLAEAATMRTAADVIDGMDRGLRDSISQIAALCSPEDIPETALSAIAKLEMQA